MRPREFLAPPWRVALRAGRAIGFGRVPAGGFRILMFHDVPQTRWHDFAALLDHIKARFGLIDPAEAARRLTVGEADGAAETDRAPCLLSFDDGFASNLALAKSLLADHGATALFFVCPGLVELPAAAQRDAVAANILDRNSADVMAPDQRLMNWDELAELRDLGHGIGAHGLNHRRLAGLGVEELTSEIEVPGRILADKLGIDVHWFAYPFGDIGAIDGAALKVIGRCYRFCRSGVRGFNTTGVHRLAILADNMDLSASRPWQKLVLEGGLDFRYRGARQRLDMLARAGDHNTPP